MIIISNTSKQYFADSCLLLEVNNIFVIFSCPFINVYFENLTGYTNHP